MLETEANSADFIRRCEEFFFITILLVITAVLLLLVLSVAIDKLVQRINELRSAQDTGLTRIL